MMTMEQFEEEKARLIILYGGTARDASGKRAQAFSRLYARSGWTQRELAAQEQLSLTRIHQLLTFGEFLEWLFTQGEQNFHGTEKHFRAMWILTDKTTSDHARYAAIAQMLTDEQTDPHRSTIGCTRRLAKQLIAQFSDGKFHRLRDIADALDVEMSGVRGLCDRIVSQGTFQTFGERRPAPTKEGSYAYRFVKGGKKKIDLTAFYAEAKPVLDEMEHIINGHSVDFSQQLMKVTFTQFRQVIDRVAR